MRTVVVFYLPQPGALKVCELEDVSDGRKPSRGDYWTFNGARYQVQEIDESLGITTGHGRVRSGNEKLLEVLSVLGFDQQTTSTLMLTMEYIGSRPVARGGLVTQIGTSQLGEFDNVVFVTTKLVRNPSNSPLSLDVTTMAAAIVTGFDECSGFMGRQPMGPTSPAGDGGDSK